MKRFLLVVLFIIAGLKAVAAPQDTRPPLSKDEVLDLLISSAPSKVVISTVKQYGIAFKPTPQVLEEFRKAGADQAVLAALRGAWQEDIPKPLGDKDVRMMLAEDVPSENIVRAVLERGVDFQPTPGYFETLRSEGAKDALIDTLRATTPRPFSKGELLQLLTTRVDQNSIVQKVQQRGIDFGLDSENLQAFQSRGARAPLLAALRTAKRAKPFVARTPAGPTLAPPLVEGKTVTLICEPADPDVPVFSEANDLGKLAARLRCGERVTFLERVVSPPGVDKIKYADGKEGFVADSYLEVPMATPGGEVKEPIAIYKPDPQYTPEARHDRIEGVVKLWIVVDAQGNVSDVLERSAPLGDGLDKSAIDTVKRWKFNPSTRNGVPVPVRVQVEITFRF